MNRRDLLALAFPGTVAAALQRPTSADDAGFFFRDGDRVVMIGDSITEQLLHSNYVESYVVSRFPKWNLAFRNVGIGGDTSRGGNARTQRDILSFKPTACTITFGMNDGGDQQPYDPARRNAYREGLQGMLNQLKAAKVRVAVLSSSPVENQANGPAMQGYNTTLEILASTARLEALKNDAVFVDQFHPHVAALQKARDVNPANRINGGDAVHPGPSGQLLMAWAILKGLGAPSLVSSAHIDARSKRARAHSGCNIRSVNASGGGVKFLRVDQALPFWIAPETRSILQWAPIERDLDRYELKVTGLKEGTYRLSIDGQHAGRFSSQALAEAANLALLTEGPIGAQSRKVHEAVFAKNRYYHDHVFRGVALNGQVPEANKAAMIEERMKGMPPLEKAIRDALVLQPHRFEVVPTA